MTNIQSNTEYDYNTTTIQMEFRRKSNDLFEYVSQGFTLICVHVLSYRNYHRCSHSYLVGWKTKFRSFQYWRMLATIGCCTKISSLAKAGCSDLCTNTNTYISIVFFLLFSLFCFFFLRGGGQIQIQEYKCQTFGFR